MVPILVAGVPIVEQEISRASPKAWKVASDICMTDRSRGSVLDFIEGRVSL